MLRLGRPRFLAGVKTALPYDSHIVPTPGDGIHIASHTSRGYNLPDVLHLSSSLVWRAVITAVVWIDHELRAAYGLKSEVEGFSVVIIMAQRKEGTTRCNVHLVHFWIE